MLGRWERVGEAWRAAIDDRQRCPCIMQRVRVVPVVCVREPKRAKSRCTMKVGDLGWVSSDADTICTVFCNTTTCVIDHSPPL